MKIWIMVIWGLQYRAVLYVVIITLKIIIQIKEFIYMHSNGWNIYKFYVLNLFNL